MRASTRSPILTYEGARIRVAVIGWILLANTRADCWTGRKGVVGGRVYKRVVTVCNVSLPLTGL